MNKITIAIDGFSSTGKSTVAKQLAKYLGYVYVDSGAMYRAVTYYAMQNGLISKDDFNVEALIYQLDNINITFKFNEKLGFAEVYLNNENIERAIRTLEVSSFVSKVAAISEVRQKLVEQQQKMGQDKGVVMDGRDIGTVVFKDAELKLYMIASAEKRAVRRFDELIERGDQVLYEDVLKNVQERDHIDSTREDSPLVKAADAIEIDNSDMTLDEQFDKILRLAKMTIEDCE
ncbi:(d)CMP kinase [Algibacter lectus]|uniref:Cytidylate kinase n=1 Tax=Algibacter lectus TaxID=221126 RepID=A0A090VEJ0_9FLAO|nr:(d)CMP kinase [Algibacter lectus]MWW25800.1 (d)CMP kinase [Algibacter lectus]TDY61082.1 cytidylate kinase [Algibacter lectus]GAL63210.1 cytidylate kinase [Algibacter lectus]SFD67925.1 cytidylate kinase [Algibacter lectus]